MKNLLTLIGIITLISLSDSQTVKARLLQQQPFQSVGTNQIAFLPWFASNSISSFNATPMNSNSFQFTQLPKIVTNAENVADNSSQLDVNPATASPNSYVPSIPSDGFTNVLLPKTSSVISPSTSAQDTQPLPGQSYASNSWFSSSGNTFSSFNSPPTLPPTSQSFTSQPIANSNNSAANNSQFNNSNIVNSSGANESIINQKFPYCVDYSDNQCWACIPGYLLNLIIQKCVLYVKPTTPLPPPAPVDTPTQPAQPQDNCNVYSDQNKTCEQCIRNYYFDTAKNLCQPVDELCRTYQQHTGSCTSCYTKYKLNAAGKCILA